MPRIAPAMIASFALLLSACGGGGGSGSPVATPAPAAPASPAPTPAPATGSVGILLTDAPSDDFDQVLVTIDAIRFIGGDADEIERTVLDTPITIDLLALTTVSELVALADIDVGTYRKIRLTVSAIALNDLDADGAILPATSRTIDPPANGRIDVVFRDGLTVADGGDDLIEIDFDVDRSFVVAGPNLRFRPVLFAERRADDDDADEDDDDNAAPQRIARLFGTVATLDGAARTFELCELRALSGRDDNRAPDARCIDVATDDTTALFDDAAAALAFDDLAVDQTAIVIGPIAARDGGARLAARVVAVGDRDDFARIGGRVAVAPSPDGTFSLVTEKDDDGLAASTAVDVTLQPDAALFTRAGATLAIGDFPVPADVELIGVRSGPADAPAIAALVAFVKADDPFEDFEGDIAAIDAATRTLSLTDDDGDSCVVVAEDADVLVVDDDSAGSSAMAATFADLQVGMEVRATGTTLQDACLVATRIAAEVEDGDDGDDGDDTGDDNGGDGDDGDDDPDDGDDN